MDHSEPEPGTHPLLGPTPAARPTSNVNVWMYNGGHRARARNRGERWKLEWPWATHFVQGGQRREGCSRRARRPACVVLVACALGLPGIARAQHDRLQLDWRAPAACPDGAEIHSRVSELPPERAAHRRALRASARISEIAGGYRLDLATNQGNRSIVASDCDELGNAAALLLSLLADGPAEAQPMAAEPARRVEPSLGASLAVDIGSLPHAAWGPALRVGMSWDSLSLELSSAYFPTQDVFAAPPSAAVGELRLITAAIGGCYALTRAYEVSPCLALAYGRLWGEGVGLHTQRTVHGDQVWVAPGLRFAAVLARAVRAVIELSLGLPLYGATFSVEPLGTVHRTAELVAQMRAGVELRL